MSKFKPGDTVIVTGDCYEGVPRFCRGSILTVHTCDDNFAMLYPFGNDPYRQHDESGSLCYRINNVELFKNDDVSAIASLKMRIENLERQLKEKQSDYVWVNLYYEDYDTYSGVGYKTKEEADRYKNPNRVACVRIPAN